MVRLQAQAFGHAEGPKLSADPPFSPSCEEF